MDVVTGSDGDVDGEEDGDEDGDGFESGETDRDWISAGKADRDLDVEKSTLSDPVEDVTVGSRGLAVVVVGAGVVDCPLL